MPASSQYVVFSKDFTTKYARRVAKRIYEHLSGFISRHHNYREQRSDLSVFKTKMVQFVCWNLWPYERGEIIYAWLFRNRPFFMLEKKRDDINLRLFRLKKTEQDEKL